MRFKGVTGVDNILDQFFNSNFGNRNQGSNTPNPFNADSFADFIYEQIKNAMPNNANGLQGSGPGQGSIGNPFQQQHQAANPVQGSSIHANKTDIKYNVFEMHGYVIVRISMSNTDPSKKKSILVNSYELLLKEEGRNTPLLHVPLPKPVSSKKTKLSMQNGILEVQIIKKATEEHSEFEISDSYNMND